MPRGNIAKEQVMNKIVNAFGNDFITIQDKKIFLWSDENGERIQVAVSLTCPKNPIEAGAFEIDTPNAGESQVKVVEPQKTTPVEISPEDKEKVQALKKMLGII